MQLVIGSFLLHIFLLVNFEVKGCVSRLRDKHTALLLIDEISSINLCKICHPTSEQIPWSRIGANRHDLLFDIQPNCENLWNVKITVLNFAVMIISVLSFAYCVFYYLLLQTMAMTPPIIITPTKAPMTIPAMRVSPIPKQNWMSSLWTFPHAFLRPINTRLDSPNR